jgi:hypothetical protein
VGKKKCGKWNENHSCDINTFSKEENFDSENIYLILEANEKKKTTL